MPKHPKHHGVYSACMKISMFVNLRRLLELEDYSRKLKIPRCFSSTTFIVQSPHPYKAYKYFYSRITGMNNPRPAGRIQPPNVLYPALAAGWKEQDTSPERRFYE